MKFLSSFLFFVLTCCQVATMVSIQSNRQRNSYQSIYLRTITRNVLSPSQEQQLLKIIKDFFDLKTYPHKSFADFSQDVINVVESHSIYKSFCTDLAKYKYTQNPLLLGIYLGQYKPLMPESVKKVIAKKKTSEILRVIKERMKKNAQ